MSGSRKQRQICGKATRIPGKRKNNLSEKIRCFADLPDGHSVGWKDAFEKGFEIFYGSILNETEAVYESPDFAEGWYVTKIVEACLKSNQTGQLQNV